MPEEPKRPDRTWLLEPLAPDEVRIHVELGEGAQVSPELRDALDRLVGELHAGEVEGFADMPPCPDLASCSNYNCNIFGKCTPQWRQPCAWDEGCRIQNVNII